MILLLLGFIAPAVLFAILGLIACVRRSAYVPIEEMKQTEDHCVFMTAQGFSRARPSISTADFSKSCSTSYQSNDPPTTLPPSYSETLALDLMGIQPANYSKSSIESSSSSSKRHLPSRQPRVLINGASTIRDAFY